MGLAAKLKNMNVFDDGTSHLGIATEVALPKLARKMEGFRAAGMDGEVDIDMGQEKLEIEYTLGGVVAAAIRNTVRRGDAYVRRIAGWRLK